MGLLLRMRRAGVVAGPCATAVLSGLLFLQLPVPARADALPSVKDRFAGDNVSEKPSFRRHVMPLLGRLGCNGRACHGSFQGQGGFRLSLFGYDFKTDHEALTAGPSPRADRTAPEQSLMLQKPTLAVSHKGGKRFEPGSWQYHLLLRWLQSGAANDAPGRAKLDRLEVSPGQLLFQRPGDHVALRVTAHWSDGTAEDVTDLTRFQSNDDAIATVTPAGQVTAAGRGDTHIVAFYDSGITPVETIVPVSQQVGTAYPDLPASTKVDELVIAKLQRLGIVPSGICTDGEFLRRVSLDLTGTLPTPEEVERFLADPSSDKRQRKVDELLERPEYAAWWTTRLCDITGNNGEYPDNFFGQDYSRLWYDWVYRRVRDNTPYDELVAGIVVANSRRPGQTLDDYCKEMTSYVRKDHPADFADRDSMPLFWSRRMALRPPDRALSFSHAFLGVRLQCAQCHKHPFDQWTKQDFDGFAAFFDRVAYGTPPTDRKAFDEMAKAVNPPDPKTKQVNQGNLAKLAREGTVVPWREIFIPPAGQPAREGQKKPATGNADPAKADPAKQAKVQPAPAKNDKKPDAKKQAAKKPDAPRGPVPQLLGGERVRLLPGSDPRAPLMAWLRRSDNPYFARAFVNRVWATYFNVGIVEPPDDLSAANPPSNAPLLDYLARGFVDSGYDMKWLHRQIVLSDTYQRSCRPNHTNAFDRRNFSHAVPRRMPAEVAYDAVSQATSSDKLLTEWRTDWSKRAIGINGLRGRRPSGVLSIFGRPERTSNCDCERSNDPSLLQTLFLLNDGELLNMVARGDGWVAQATRPFMPPPPPKKDGKAATNAKVAPTAKAPPAAKAAKRPTENKKPARPPVPTAEQVARLIRDAYLRTVSRPPTDEEVTRARQYVKASPNLNVGLRDLLWALLNTDEFIVNH